MTARASSLILCASFLAVGLAGCHAPSGAGPGAPRGVHVVVLTGGLVGAVVAPEFRSSTVICDQLLPWEWAGAWNRSETGPLTLEWYAWPENDTGDEGVLLLVDVGQLTPDAHCDRAFYAWLSPGETRESMAGDPFFAATFNVTRPAAGDDLLLDGEPVPVGEWRTHRENRTVAVQNGGVVETREYNLTITLENRGRIEGAPVLSHAYDHLRDPARIAFLVATGTSDLLVVGGAPPRVTAACGVGLFNREHGNGTVELAGGPSPERGNSTDGAILLVNTRIGKTPFTVGCEGGGRFRFLAPGEAEPLAGGWSGDDFWLNVTRSADGGDVFRVDGIPIPPGGNVTLSRIQEGDWTWEDGTSRLRWWHNWTVEFRGYYPADIFWHGGA